MRIDLLCSDRNHPIYPLLESWVTSAQPIHTCRLTTTVSELEGGDILFLVSVSEVVGRNIRSKYRVVIVLHASDLPKGRGWSPLIWQILEGKREIVVTAFEAADLVDSGPIWAQRIIAVESHELHNEVNEKLFGVELQLIDQITKGLATIRPTAQREETPTYYRRRTPDDSRIDPELSISEQFDLLRVSDPDRYPAFFDLRGYRYKIRIEKVTALDKLSIANELASPREGTRS